MHVLKFLGYTVTSSTTSQCIFSISTLCTFYHLQKLFYVHLPIKEKFCGIRKNFRFLTEKLEN